MGLCTLCTNGYWAVNGTPIYIPTSVTIEHDNIVGPDSGRVESGKMRIKWVRRDVRKIDLTFERITGAELEFMHQLMQGKEFQFTYYDNGLHTIDAYSGKNSYTQKNLNAYASEGGLYTDFKINIVEM